MEGIYVGKVKRSIVGKDNANLFFVDHRQDITNLDSVIEYDDTAYCLVPSDDILINNDELLKLRDEVKRLTDKCNEWMVRYSTANNELFQKGLAYGTLEGAYKNEKIAGKLLLKDRDALKERVENLEEELMEIKTARTLREAYISGVEKGCESLREERDRWRNRCNSVMTDLSKSLEQHGINFTLKEIDGDGNWNVDIDIPELNEAKKKVEDLEKELAAAKSNETFWRDRHDEEKDYHHYWMHTFDRAVKQAADKGIYIDVRTTDEECNAGVVIVNNVKAEELGKRISSADERIKELEKQINKMANTNKILNQKIGAADNALEYWDNTYNDIVIAGKNAGVKIDIKGKKLDSNTGFVYVTNNKALELMWKLHDRNQRHYNKWSAMLDALKDKGVEVVYMGEEDGKPIIDVKVPEIDILRKDYIVRGQTINDPKKELEALKSRTLDKVEIRLNMGDIVWTYCDGFVHVSSKIDIGHINCLCKNHVAIDAESISHGTIPTCKSCAHYMHNSDRFAHRWCYKPISKEGPGSIRKLSKEEADGPCCKDYKEREPMCKDCIYQDERGCVGTRTGEACFSFKRKKTEE